jgi:hypothetical protein
MTSTSGEATRNGAPVLPDSVKMLMTPRGSASTSEDLRYQIGDQRGLPRHLDGHGISGRKRRGQQTDQQCDRGIPRHDDPDHPRGLRIGREPLAGGDLGGDASAGQGHRRVVEKRRARRPALEQPLGELLAVLLRNKGPEFLCVRGETRCHLKQNLVAKPPVAPPGGAVEGPAGGGDRGGRFRPDAVVPLPENFSGRRVE